MNQQTRKNIVVPQAMSGFPEWLPAEKILENKVLGIIRRYYELYGFSPIETPAVERREVLTAKGGNEKEIYSLARFKAEDDDTKDYALHFDLTVPLARYVAQHYGELAFPFRRYQIQKVWRGERPQAGRFREFYQADIDIIGDGSLNPLSDAEIPSIIYRIFNEMGIGQFKIRISNRKILQGYFQSLGIPENVRTGVMRTVDKLEKVGSAQVMLELVRALSLDQDVAKNIVEFVSIEFSNGVAPELEKLAEMKINEHFSTGVSELLEVVRGVQALGVPEENFQVDLKVARGLDYYTGTVYETMLVDNPGIGSICSGGRFDNLASYFTDKKLPGVGISIGVTRLLSRLIKANILETSASTVAQVLVTIMDQSRRLEYLKIANVIRDSGVNVEVYLEDRRIGDQLKYANKKHFPFAIIAGETEFSTGSVVLKDLRTGAQEIVPVLQVAKKILSSLVV